LASQKGDQTIDLGPGRSYRMPVLAEWCARYKTHKLLGMAIVYRAEPMADGNVQMIRHYRDSCIEEAKYRDKDAVIYPNCNNKGSGMNCSSFGYLTLSTDHEGDVPYLMGRVLIYYQVQVCEANSRFGTPLMSAERLNKLALMRREDGIFSLLRRTEVPYIRIKCHYWGEPNYCDLVSLQLNLYCHVKERFIVHRHSFGVFLTMKEMVFELFILLTSEWALREGDLVKVANYPDLVQKIYSLESDRRRGLMPYLPYWMGARRRGRMKRQLKEEYYGEGGEPPEIEGDDLVED